MRIVIDTNVFISASLFPDSVTDQVIRWCLQKTRVYFSHATIEELRTRIT